ncbi:MULTISPECIES: V-type ATP synthase subunit E [unclassified Ruminococcus]|uniref:V-type ATP synthase subunit E n=1 Tax=unclassified Ruminococcus TaxID=2608920 RepID=UPI00210A903C|nr:MULTISPECIES: V-type ATP synthase subunit E [unclassified Ruminococcus]MCQ4022638.1 hypothetical protein [Ruminococcus sp. zg-924]MCQ4114878.1 hypothetical protein [Ruminococcus sp. zg-921]
MNGLDKILQQIKEDSDAAVAKIKGEAEKSAFDNKQKILKEAEKEVAAITAKTQSECEDIKTRSESSASLVKKQAMLNAKQKIISDLIKKAHKSLLSLPENEYFSIIKKMVEKNSHKNEQGKIAFNKADSKRLPKDFGNALSQLSNGMLTLTDDTANIDGGFVLIYGGIEENCSFDAIFSEKYDELQDEVYSLLFS